MEKFKSIKFLMSAYFTTIMILGILFTGITVYEKFNDTAQEYAAQSVDQLVSQVKYSLDTYTRNMLDVSNTLYYKIIKNQNITNHKFIPQMNVIQTTNTHIASLAIFKENGELIAATQYSKVKDGMDVTTQSWFENAIIKPENVHFSSPHKQNIFEGVAPWVVSLSRAVSLNQDGSIIQGVLLVDMNLTGIKNICSPIDESDTGAIYIIAPDQEVVYGEYVDENMSKVLSEVEMIKDGVKTIDDEKLILTTKTASYTGWKIVGIWQLDKVLLSFTEMKDFMMMILTVGSLMSVIGTLVIASRLTSPLYKLQKSMKLVEKGDFDIQLEEGGEYIVSELSKTFNKMVLRIRDLMDEIVREQDSKRKKEMEVLQSQINPHFLYNTLDSIIWLIEDERLEEATLMITALSRFFRISISQGRNVITVREELEHAKNYLSIQKIRYRNKFEYEIHAEESVLEAKTIKLILQPIIENALYHGIEYIHHKGLIRIDVWKEEEVLIYRIADNGVGMTQEVSDKLFEGKAKVLGKGSGVGVRNVYKRIKIYYGEAYGMEVESELEEGTILWIHIPVQYE